MRGLFALVMAIARRRKMQSGANNSQLQLDVEISVFEAQSLPSLVKWRNASAAVNFIRNLPPGSPQLTEPVNRRVSTRAMQRFTFFPSYIEPHRLAEFSKRQAKTRTLIINPNSGPGDAPDPGIQQACLLLQASGAILLGYVPTEYTKRALAEVSSSIQKFITWYGVNGIFFDETDYRVENLSYYRQVAAFARGQHQPYGIVAMNPGMVPAREYFDLADVTVTFEGPASKYSKALADTPRWIHAIPAYKIAHILYDASRDAALYWARSTPAGHFYATSGVLPNPWITLPDYFDEMEAAYPGSTAHHY